MTDSKPEHAEEPKVFVSYSRDDLAFVDRLRGELPKHGIEVLVDSKDIEKGEDFWERIQDLIAESDSVLVVLPRCLNSEICLREIALAQNLNKRLFPLIVGSLEQQEVPDELARLNYIYFIEDARAAASGEFDEAVGQLASALKTDLDWIREHTRLGLLAQRWQDRRRADALFLRGQELESAEAWIADRPASAPPPTSLHREYLAASRRAATTRLRKMLALSVVAVLVASSLAAFASWQRGIARERLAGQRVQNGTNSALDGNQAAALDWYVDALRIAEESRQSETRHRARLAALRELSPLCVALWREDGEVAGIEFSPDSSHFAVLVEEGQRGANGRLRVYRRNDLSLVCEHTLKVRTVRHLRFHGEKEIHLLGSFADGGCFLRLSSRSAQTIERVTITKDRRFVAVKDGTLNEPVLPLQEGESIVAFGPDGNLVATSSRKSGSLRVRKNERHADSGTLVPLPVGDDLQVHSPHLVVFHPSGDRLILLGSAGRKSSVCTLTEDEIQQSSTFECHGTPTSVIFPSRGRMLVTGKDSDDRLVTELWKLDPIERLRRFDHELASSRWEFPRDPLNTGAGAGSAAPAGIARSWMSLRQDAILAANGDRLLTHSVRGQRYRVWDIYSGRVITKQIPHHSAQILALAFSPDGRFVLSGARDGSVRMMDVALPRFKHLLGSMRVVQGLEFHPNKRDQLLVSFEDGAEMVNWRTGCVLFNFDGKAEFDPSGCLVADSGPDSVRLFNAEDLQANRIEIPFQRDRRMEWSESGRYLLLWTSHYSKPNQFALTDTSTGVTVASGKLAGRGYGDAFLSERLARACLEDQDDDEDQDEIITIRFADPQRPIVERNPIDRSILNFLGVNGDRIVALTTDGSEWYDRGGPGAARENKIFDNAGGLSRLIARHPELDLVVLSDPKKLLAQVYRISSGRAVSPVFVHDWPLQSARLCRDGEYLVSYSGNKAHLWEVQSGQAIVPEFELPDTVTAAAFDSKTGAFAASAESGLAGKSHTIYLLDAAPLVQPLADLQSFARVNGAHVVDRAGGRVPLELKAVLNARDQLTREKLVQIVPELDAQTWHWRLIRQTEGGIESEANHLQRIVASNPDDLAAQRKLARNLGWLKRIDEAIAVHETLLAKGHFDQGLAYADLLKKNQRTSAALKVLDRIVEHDPSASALSARATLRWQTGDLSGALDDYLAIKRKIDASARSPKEKVQLAVLAAVQGKQGILDEICAQLTTRARRLKDEPNKTLLKWNAAYYAAAACVHSPDRLSELAELVEMMEANLIDGMTFQKKTLDLFRAAVELREGNPRKAMNLTEKYTDVPEAVIVHAAAQQAADGKTTDTKRLEEIRRLVIDSSDTSSYQYRTQLSLWLRTLGLND